jgi:hypothetical protein
MFIDAQRTPLRSEEPDVFWRGLQTAEKQTSMKLHEMDACFELFCIISWIVLLL